MRHNYILLILTLFFAVSISNGQSNKKASSMIVKNAFMNRSDIYKPNAAILITDKDELKDNLKLFKNNNDYQHACGYHYTIQLWSNSVDLIKSIPFNQECEEFVKHNGDIQKIMKGYIKNIETSPTHFIYNIKIPVAIQRDLTIDSLINDKHLAYMMNSKTSHLTTISFSYFMESDITSEDNTQWLKEIEENERKCTEKINQIIKEINIYSQIIEKSDIRFNEHSFGGGTISHKGIVSLKFPNGMDLTEIKEIIIESNGTIENEYTPDFYYIQLLDVEESIENIKLKLIKYHFIDNVFEYPKRK